MKHAGHELELLIAGKKAMAAFCHVASDDVDPTDGQDFKSAVRSGQICVRRFFVNRKDLDRLIYTVYFLPNEGWRFEVYRSLKKSITSGWSIDKEIIESILLDYNRDGLKKYLEILLSFN